MSRRRKARGRDIDGILLLDKPVGISSNHALQHVKRMFNAKKAGHTGSLDPLAGGLLPICFGEATKFSNYMLNADKSYSTVCRLGETTTTGDTEGEVVKTRDVPDLSFDHVEDVLCEFLGESDQIPPMYSALKQNGQPLYKLARKGEVVERKPRKIIIDGITLVRLEGNELEFDVSCSKGTYVRTLTEDIGERLGCGAHVIALTRFDLGLFHIDDAVSMQALHELRDEEAFAAMDEYIQPIQSALENWPKIQLNQDSTFYLKQGQSVMVPKAPANGEVTLFDNNDVFIGIGEIQDDGKVAPRRLVNTSS